MPWGGQMVDMELTDDEKLDREMPYLGVMERSDYPPGLRISLTECELQKLGLSADPKVGDILDMRCFAVVCSVSTDKRDDRETARVELQIERMALAEDDGDENDV